MANNSQAHSTIRPGCVAAFSIEVDEEERLVVIAELRSAEKERNTLQDISSSVSRNIMKDHQLPCFGILLIAPRTIPKTTSGKIQRHGAKKFYLYECCSLLLNEAMLLTFPPPHALTGYQPHHFSGHRLRRASCTAFSLITWRERVLVLGWRVH